MSREKIAAKPSRKSRLAEKSLLLSVSVNIKNTKRRRSYICSKNGMVATCNCLSNELLLVCYHSDLSAETMYVELCRAVSPLCDCFVIYVVTSPTTAFALTWSRSSTLGSIMATSCLLGFLPISNDVCRPYSTPQLAWYFDFVAI